MPGKQKQITDVQIKMITGIIKQKLMKTPLNEPRIAN